MSVSLKGSLYVLMSLSDIMKNEILLIYKENKRCKTHMPDVHIGQTPIL